MRAKEYERDEVVRNAANLFWERGYKATSVSDIVAATGLNTASMYKEFGDKDGLFEAALDYYRSQVMGPRFKLLTESPNMKGVEAFLRGLAKGAARKEYRGCLMMNHLAQTNVIGTGAADKISDFCSAVETLLEKALCNAQAQGDLPRDKDPAEVASFIMCCVHGLVLYGRHPKKKALIQSLSEAMLRAVRD